MFIKGNWRGDFLGGGEILKIIDRYRVYVYNIILGFLGGGGIMKFIDIGFIFYYIIF